jgi:hypothetical protein
MRGWTLELADGVYDIDPSHHDVDTRVATAGTDGLDVVGVAASAALGIDRLPEAEAAELAEAWLSAALELPAPFRVWATGRDPVALRAALDRGAIGLELAADALAAPGGLDELAPLLEALGDRPLLVHPGPARRIAAAGAGGRPEWWAPVVDYVADLHAAWWAWADGGRERYPDLPVCFAALAGLGPLHGERQRARGGHTAAVDPLTFVETSSYGTLAVDAVMRVLGIDVICHGSDRPYADPAPLAFDAAATHAFRSTNPGRLLAHVPQEVLL